MHKEFFGFGSIQKLGELIEKYQARKIFLVTGKNSFILSGAEQKIKQHTEKIKCTQFNSFGNNPDINEVKHGISIFKKINPDLVIAVGGGSVIDMAKSVNVLSYQDGKIEEYSIGKKKLKNPGKPLIAIPTTSGTGSEVTYFATIYIDKTKYSLGDKNLTLPSISIVDPSLTESLTKYLTASTGLDALCQGIESFWAVNSTKKSRKCATEAIDIAFKNIEKTVKNPDKESRLNMAKAAHLSGKAINISKTTACHSISYPITSYFGISHGHAVALTMPQFIEFNSQVSEKDCNDKRGVKLVKNRINEIIEIMGCKDIYDVKKKFQNLMREIRVGNKLSELNMDIKSIELIIEKGFTADRMNNNPRKVTEEALRKILEEIL
ncbi:MAG: phosphonoacetaldehyde reductase [Thermoplasmatales archaeon]|nr:MAG: phosphonoacetaldehyde reductase [Thermoplasmatales archaeon]